ncbi:hypothetical protein AHAS_Ahas17G0176600 [Arachis hypogaea]
MEFTSSFDQSYHMGYCPPPQNVSSHYSNSGWEYHQEMIDYEQSTQWGYAPELQNDLCHYHHGVWAYQQECEQSSEMGYFPEPQHDSYCCDNYTNCGWEGQNQRNLSDPYFSH